MCDKRLFKENFNKLKIFINLIPELVEKKEPPIDAKDWENVENKFQEHFSDKPGK